MEQTFQYKGYLGSIELSLEDEVLHGKLLYINDLVTYEGDTISELKNAFIESVEDYISFCAKNGKSPEKSFKGSFNIRIPPELHRTAAIEATKQNITLNQFVIQSLENEINGSHNEQRITMIFPIISQPVYKNVDDSNFSSISQSYSL